MKTIRKPLSAALWRRCATGSLLLGLSSSAIAGDELPPAPEPPERADPYQPERVPSFGSDVAIGYTAGALLGSWPDSGLSGMVLARYDVFLVDRDTDGARLGLSLWGATTAWPRQRFTEAETGRTDLFGMSSYGVMTVLRSAPAAPLGAAAGLGFGRTDLGDYYEGPLAIPTLSFEGGARLRMARIAFLDVLARAHWGTTRSPTADSYHEWWGAQVLLSPGLHLR